MPKRLRSFTCLYDVFEIRPSPHPGHPPPAGERLEDVQCPAPFRRDGKMLYTSSMFLADNIDRPAETRVGCLAQTMYYALPLQLERQTKAIADSEDFRSVG